MCKIFVDLKILINIPAILGYQFVQSEKMINLLSLIARNKPHHAKVSKSVVLLEQFVGILIRGLARPNINKDLIYSITLCHKIRIMIINQFKFQNFKYFNIFNIFFNCLVYQFVNYCW